MPHTYPSPELQKRFELHQKAHAHKCHHHHPHHPQHHHPKPHNNGAPLHQHSQSQSPTHTHQHQQHNHNHPHQHRPSLANTRHATSPLTGIGTGTGNGHAPVTQSGLSTPNSRYLSPIQEQRILSWRANTSFTIPPPSPASSKAPHDSNRVKSAPASLAFSGKTPSGSSGRSKCPFCIEVSTCSCSSRGASYPPNGNAQGHSAPGQLGSSGSSSRRLKNYYKSSRTKNGATNLTNSVTPLTPLTASSPFHPGGPNRQRQMTSDGGKVPGGPSPPGSTTYPGMVDYESPQNPDALIQAYPNLDRMAVNTGGASKQYAAPVSPEGTGNASEGIKGRLQFQPALSREALMAAQSQSQELQQDQDLGVGVGPSARHALHVQSLPGPPLQGTAPLPDAGMPLPPGPPGSQSAPQQPRIAGVRDPVSQNYFKNMFPPAPMPFALQPGLHPPQVFGMPAGRPMGF